jgi:acyl carrier protein
MSQIETTPPGCERNVLEDLSRALPHLKHLLTREQPLPAVGLDSIDLVELLCVIESEFKVRMSEEDLSSAKTVGELADGIDMRYRQRRNES